VSLTRDFERGRTLARRSPRAVPIACVFEYAPYIEVFGELRP
jgi:hypothetical protein